MGKSVTVPARLLLKINKENTVNRRRKMILCMEANMNYVVVKHTWYAGKVKFTAAKLEQKILNEWAKSRKYKTIFMVYPPLS